MIRHAFGNITNFVHNDLALYSRTATLSVILSSWNPNTEVNG